MLKGTVAVVIAGYFGGPNAAMLAALGAFLGHLFPVWLKFKGGKGVAVYIGVLIGSVLAGGRGVLRDVARDRRRPRATRRSRRWSRAFVTPIFLWWFGHPALASLFAVLTHAAVLHAPRKHQAVAGRDRRADRGEVASIAFRANPTA